MTIGHYVITGGKVDCHSDMTADMGQNLCLTYVHVILTYVYVILTYAYVILHGSTNQIIALTYAYVKQRF